MMGQPVLGNRDNINNLNEQMCKQYVANTFVGSKVIVSVSGKGVDHKQVVQSCEKGLASLKSQSSVEDNNTEKPDFTASSMFMRDDELANVNTGVFF